MASQKPKKFTIEEYLAFERQSQTRHDYYNGEIFQVSGTERRHHQLLVNITSELQRQLKGSEYEVHDLQVQAPGNMLTSPVVAVARGSNPIVVFEVVFPTPEMFEQATTLPHYTSMASIREVLLIALAKIYAEHYIRGEASEWLLQESDEPFRLEIPTLARILDLRKLYEPGHKCPGYPKTAG